LYRPVPFTLIQWYVTVALAHVSVSVTDVEVLCYIIALCVCEDPPSSSSSSWWTGSCWAWFVHSCALRIFIAEILEIPFSYYLDVHSTRRRNLALSFLQTRECSTHSLFRSVPSLSLFWHDPSHPLYHPTALLLYFYRHKTTLPSSSSFWLATAVSARRPLSSAT
jgi:hypothetical protein